MDQYTSYVALWQASTAAILLRAFGYDTDGMGPHEMRDALASALGSPVDFHMAPDLCFGITAHSQRNVAKLHDMQAMIVGNDAMMESLRTSFDRLTTEVSMPRAAHDVDAELEHATRAMRSLMNR
ncbi:hypothetical protein SPRG_04006 [Saprolegnia parasitica CBS 223.65]|uniref:Uncharacterized protein n=1 Tax=Saprolegnia parasitica (strain CBS 223.65) TaxID=695850 RepID=A0A067CL00_SAPPC|nr:hypothetical protein SPRG_04006 [Saprolegnia parasitica CBS 223.65]KDO31389.1 hypothetical protein SPRG_04006 [Saprolegnia parasitica CBS 223.65]|eukprot:XP_012197986.1 hypothetical protein SPRG_04006 [Saprolegnia parasitica CBS 223.65]